MKSTLVFVPHGDDESLFVAYSCMRTKAHIIICTQDADPLIRRKRTQETSMACRILGCSHHEWPLLASAFDRKQAKIWLGGWNSLDARPNRVFAPAVHAEGHEEHNVIGELAVSVFGHDLVTPYLTYAPRGQRSRYGVEVEPPTTDEIVRKLRALACYETQISNPATRPWFFDLLDLREWVA